MVRTIPVRYPVQPVVLVVEERKRERQGGKMGKIEKDVEIGIRKVEEIGKEKEKVENTMEKEEKSSGKIETGIEL